MGKEEYFNRGKYADMLTGNLDKICEIASKTNGMTNMPYALMGYTPEQCAMAEQFVNQIRKVKAEQDEAEFQARLAAAAAKFRKQNEANKFFKRNSRNAANQIEIDKQTIIMLGNLWKANLNPDIIRSEEFDGLDIPTDIVLGGMVALDDVEIEFPVYLDCATGDARGYVMNDNRAKIAKARFIMRQDYGKHIEESTEQTAFCDVHMEFISTNRDGKRYEFTMGTELMIRKDEPNYVFYNDEFAIKGRSPGRIMAFMAERILVYYTAIWYSIMLAYLHPLTITSIVDVGKKMAEEYAHNPIKNKAPLKNIRYLRLDGKTLEKVLYHSKPGKGKKYERHCQLWPVRGYKRRDGKWIGPQWRGPLAKMKRLADDVQARQRKIVGVSLDADEKK